MYSMEKPKPPESRREYIGSLFWIGVLNITFPISLFLFMGTVWYWIFKTKF